MKKNTHINVTIDFKNWNDEMYDLRIPTQQTVKQLLLSLEETLSIPMPVKNLFTIKVLTKNILLVDEDYLMDYPITNGDFIIVS